MADDPQGESLRKWIEEHPVKNPDPDFWKKGLEGPITSQDDERVERRGR